MSSPEDTKLGQAAVERGFITKSQLDESMKALEFVTQAGLKRTLVDLLVEKELLTEVQAQIVRRSAESDEVRIIAGFELIEKLGEGGMGSVYKARQMSMDRLVALKTLSPGLAADNEFTQRFLREARTAGMLDHVNIVSGLEVGREGEIYYFAMEFVEGESVGDILKRDEKMPEDRALHIILQVARALEYAWKEKQLIHRDIKPDNILVTKGDIAKLADLGLARTTDTESTMLTRTGVAMGTPHYISPEQARGDKDIDIRTDIYSLGATLYHMLVGESPFSGSSAMAVITKHLTENAIPAHVASPGVSEALSNVVDKMMRKEPAGRYADPSELIADLELVGQGKSPVLAGGPAPERPLAPSQTGTLLGMDTLRDAGAAARGKSRALVAVGAVAMAALLVAVALLALRSASANRRAQVEIDQIEELLQAHQIEAARDRARAAEELIAATSHADRLEALMKEIDAELEEKQATEEAASKAAVLRSAESAVEEVRTLVSERRFADARTKLEASRPALEAALARHDEAPKIEALAAEIAKAEVDYAEKLVAAAGAHERNREWQDARAKYAQALKHLSGARRDEVRAISEGLDRRMELEDALAVAEREAADGRWLSVWTRVGKVRKSGVKDARVEKLAERAIAALAPAKELVGPLATELVFVPGGTFRMGSAAADGGEADERPAHGVTVSSFYVGRFEVTRAQFEAFRRGLRDVAAAEDGRKPVGSVSWRDAVEFCKYLGNIDPKGNAYRLPTEAEWEYVARGSEGRRYPWGNTPSAAGRGNFLVGGKAPEIAPNGPADVGSFPAGATPSGVHDMAGNVFEWCSDWYGPYPSSAQADPGGPVSGAKRVARGGAYGIDVAAARSALRGTRPPDKPLPMIGFRVVRALSDEEKAFERLARNE